MTGAIINSMGYDTPCSMVRTSRAADSMSQRYAASRSSGRIELLQIPHSRLPTIGVTKDCRGCEIDRGDAERRLQFLLEASEPWVPSAECPVKARSRNLHEVFAVPIDPSRYGTQAEP
jgi:hypothetical protein